MGSLSRGKIRFPRNLQKCCVPEVNPGDERSELT